MIGRNHCTKSRRSCPLSSRNCFLFYFSQFFSFASHLSLNQSKCPSVKVVTHLFHRLVSHFVNAIYKYINRDELSMNTLVRKVTHQLMQGEKRWEKITEIDESHITRHDCKCSWNWFDYNLTEMMWEWRRKQKLRLMFLARSLWRETREEKKKKKWHCTFDFIPIRCI